MRSWKLRFTVLVTLAVITAAAGCGKKDEPQPTVTDTTVANLQSISSQFAPAPLTYSGATAAMLRNARTTEAREGNPCAAYSGSPTALFDCQPVLLRIYIDMSKQFLDMATTLIGGIGTNLGNLADGASGTITSGTQVISFTKPSATSFSLLVKEGSNSVGYVNVADNVYTIRFDFSKMSDADANAPGQMEFVVNYTSADTWSITSTALGMECDPTDVRAPRQVKILMSKTSGLWTGKAMLYNGVWANGIGGGSEPTCATADSDAASMALYTDFVGDASAAKAKVYMMKRDINDASSFADLKDFCTTYGIAGCNLWFNSANFTNPFCNVATSLTAQWGNSCAASSSAVAAAAFGSATDWVMPSVFSDSSVTKITLPSAL